MEIEAPPAYTKEEMLESYMNDLEVIKDDESVKSETKTVMSDVSDSIKKFSTMRKSVKGDVGYHKYFIERGNKKIRIELYGTKLNIGSYIRCPITGIRLDDKVGSLQENNYFKVNMSSITNGDENMSFFYNTPEEFERHHLVILPQYIKNDWYEKKK